MFRWDWMNGLHITQKKIDSFLILAIGKIARIFFAFFEENHEKYKENLRGYAIIREQKMGSVK